MAARFLTRARFSIIDWLLAQDPAFSRLRMGARVTLTMLVSVGLLIAFHVLVTALPPIAFGLAIILSIEGGVAVRDRKPRDQMITRLLGCLASLAAVGVAALLEDNRYVSDVVFLGVILLATLARVYGPRGFAIGMFAFTSYFIGAYLRPSITDLPLAALGPIVAVAIGHAVRTFLITDDRKRDLLQSLIGIQGRVNAILIKLAVLSAAREWSPADRRELQHLEERLKDVAMTAEGFLPRPTDGAIDAAQEKVTAMATAIFDVHLAAEGAIVIGLESLPPFPLVHAVLEQDSETVEGFATLHTGDTPADESVRALTWLHTSRLALSAMIEEGRRDQFRSLQEEMDKAPTAAPIDFSLKNPVVRAALQITIASAIAMVGGLMLSRDRWFWAVLTAFLVFTNAKSRGDAALRAVQRSIGTLLGIAMGLVLATLLGGHALWLTVFATLGVFFAFYSLQVSYAVMTFFVSITLCLVYGLIGTLTTEILILRVEETLIGAVAGTLVSFLVFPASTRSTLDTALDRWYKALRALLVAARDGQGGFRMVELSSDLDAAYREVTTAARPLGTSWSIVTKPGKIRQTLAIFLASTYWARTFARSHVVPVESSDEMRTAIDAAITRLDAASVRRSECFFAEMQERPQPSRHLPVFKDGARLGVDMVAAMLDRLYPKA